MAPAGVQANDRRKPRFVRNVVSNPVQDRFCNKTSLRRGGGGEGHQRLHQFFCNDNPIIFQCYPLFHRIIHDDTYKTCLQLHQDHAMTKFPKQRCLHPQPDIPSPISALQPIIRCLALSWVWKRKPPFANTRQVSMCPCCWAPSTTPSPQKEALREPVAQVLLGFQGNLVHVLLLFWLIESLFSGHLRWVSCWRSSGCCCHG